MPLVQKPDGFPGEFPRPIQDLVQQCADGSQTRCEDRRGAFAGELFEVHDQAVDRQKTGIATRFDESQFLTQLCQNPGRADYDGDIVLAWCHLGLLA
jgi:hypothetical protein